MEKLINFTGGRGYYVDDTRSLQQQLDLLKRHLFESPFTAPDGSALKSIDNISDFVIGGCEVENGVIQTGLVRIADTMIHVDQPLTPSSFPCWMVYSTNTDLNSRLYLIDQVDKPAFQKTVASLVYTEPAGPSIRFDSTGPARKFWDYIRQLQRFHSSEWVSLPILNGWQGSCEYYVSREGFVYLRGHLRGFGATNFIFSRLPNNMFVRGSHIMIPGGRYPSTDPDELNEYKLYNEAKPFHLLLDDNTVSPTARGDLSIRYNPGDGQGGVGTSEIPEFCTIPITPIAYLDNA